MHAMRHVCVWPGTQGFDLASAVICWVRAVLRKTSNLVVGEGFEEELYAHQLIIQSVHYYIPGTTAAAVSGMSQL